MRIGTVSCVLPLSVRRGGNRENRTRTLGRNKLTIHEFSDGLRQRLNTAGEIPGILLDVEAQLFGAVHLRLHLLLKLCGKTYMQKIYIKKKKLSGGRNASRVHTDPGNLNEPTCARCRFLTFALGDLKREGAVLEVCKVKGGVSANG